VQRIGQDIAQRFVFQSLVKFYKVNRMWVPPLKFLYNCVTFATGYMAFNLSNNSIASLDLRGTMRVVADVLPPNQK